MAITAILGICATNLIEWHLGPDALYRYIFARTVGCAPDAACNLEVTIPALLVEDGVALVLCALLLAAFGVYRYLQFSINSNRKGH
jgi:hypothetical protein